MKENYVYACDDTYAILAGISIISLFEENRSAEEITVFIFSDRISSENCRRLRSIGEDFHREIIIIDVVSELQRLQELGVTGYDNAEGSVFAAYARLLIGELLPEGIDRIVYLDCDTLINGDISMLFKINMQDKTLAMAYDCMRNEYKLFIGKKLNDNYYNSGVMIVDLNNWRAHDCMGKVFFHMKNVRASYPLVDQDLINMALSDEIVKLNPKYNVLSQYFLYDHKNTLKVYGYKSENWYNENEFNEAMTSSIIYHFCGKSFIRPWFTNSVHPMKTKYDSYYYKSPWKDDRQNKYNMSIPYKIQYAFYKYSPMWISGQIGRIMQRIFIFTTYKC